MKTMTNNIRKHDCEKKIGSGNTKKYEEDKEKTCDRIL